jgi:hypothetical protein
LKSPTIEFGEDSDSILVENLLASVSQHQRQKNSEQTVNRMRARTMNGYILSERLETEGKPHHALEDMSELALSFLSNPWKFRDSGECRLRRDRAPAGLFGPHHLFPLERVFRT